MQKQIKQNERKRKKEKIIKSEIKKPKAKLNNRINKNKSKTNRKENVCQKGIYN